MTFRAALVSKGTYNAARAEFRSMGHSGRTHMFLVENLLGQLTAKDNLEWVGGAIGAGQKTRPAPWRPLVARSGL